MGEEARCAVRFGNARSEGKALLETDELLFRGEFRIAVPLKGITALDASDGELRVEFADGEATFELGPKAERWAERIKNPKSLLDKLGVKPKSSVAVVDLDDGEFLERSWRSGSSATPRRPSTSPTSSSWARSRSVTSAESSHSFSSCARTGTSG